MSEWSVDNLKEYVEALGVACRRHTDDRFEAMEEETRRALASAEKAVEKAERLADIRAEVQDRMAADRAKAQNEWRASLQDMTTTYMSHTEYEAKHAVLEEKLASLSHRHDKDMMLLREEFSEHRGRGVGANQAWVWVFLGVGALVGLGGFLFGLIELLTK